MLKNSDIDILKDVFNILIDQELYQNLEYSKTIKSFEKLIENEVQEKKKRSKKSNEYNKIHREKIKNTKEEYMKRYYKANKEKYRKYMHEYYQKRKAEKLAEAEGNQNEKV